MDTLTLEHLPGRYAVCRLEPTESIPGWAIDGTGVYSITRTRHELSIIATEAVVPDDVQSEKGYAAYEVQGPLDFAIIGLLAKLTTALAEVKVPVLAISTYDTDILLIKADQRHTAERALDQVADIHS